MEEKEPNPPPAISLRRFELSDVDGMMEWVSDPLLSRYMTWETLHSRDEALAYLIATILPHPWYRAVCLGDGKPVRFMFVRPGAGTDRCRAEVSCSLAHRHWGRGIAPAAVRMAARDVFDE